MKAENLYVQLPLLSEEELERFYAMCGMVRVKKTKNAWMGRDFRKRLNNIKLDK